MATNEFRPNVGEKVHVRPKSGLKVMDPGAPRGARSKDICLPAEGRVVVWSTYWERRLDDAKGGAEISISRPLSAAQLAKLAAQPAAQPVSQAESNSGIPAKGGK